MDVVIGRPEYELMKVIVSFRGSVLKLIFVLLYFLLCSFGIGLARSGCGDILGAAEREVVRI